MPSTMTMSRIIFAAAALVSAYTFAAPIAHAQEQQVAERIVIQAPAKNRAVIYGRAIDTTGRPIMGVHIDLVGTRRSTVTNDDGFFILRDLSPDLYIVSAKRLGFEPRVFDLSVTGGEIVQMGLELERQAQLLEVVRVSDVAFKPERLAYTTKFDDFYFRREKGGGTFFDRDQLEHAGARDIYDLLRTVPGMRVRTSGWSQSVTMSSCPSPLIYFDGVLTSNSLVGINDMRLSDIEAIEVYRSMSSLPTHAKAGCGAIFFWFRSTAR
ncbi:MAG: carboxypeptidase regulatory-like domain-containing protein [Gemmatimonadaceae bacterium]|nr:carboxypeptidase regulatory-like domain-containing protein [Gemmatimonadaceae bacterium]